MANLRDSSSFSHLNIKMRYSKILASTKTITGTLEFKSINLFGNNFESIDLKISVSFRR